MNENFKKKEESNVREKNVDNDVGGFALWNIRFFAIFVFKNAGYIFDVNA